MAQYKVQAPDGHTITLEGPDGASDAEIMSQAQRLYQPKADATTKRGLLDPFTDAVAGAAGRVKQNFKEDVEHAKSTGGDSFVSDFAGSFAKPFAPGGVLRGAKVIGDLYGAAASPIQGAINVVAEPLERATRFGGEKGLDLNQALMAAKPGPATAPRPLPPPKVNALAAPVAAFDRAGVTPSLATASGGRGMSTATNVVAENALAGPAVRARLRGAVEQADVSAQRLAGQYGEVRGRQITGENVQAGVNRFAKDRTVASSGASEPAKVTSFAAKSDKLYDDAFGPIETAEAQQVDRLSTKTTVERERLTKAHADEVERITASHADAVKEATRQEEVRASRMGTTPKAHEVPDPIFPDKPTLPDQPPAVIPSQTITTLHEVAGRVNGQQLSNMITDARPREIARALEADAHNVRFKDLRELRTWVRNARGNPELRQGIGSAGLERIEGALTSDIYASAERLGGKPALAKLQRADQFYKAGQQRIKQALQPFDDASSGESAYSRIVQAAGSTGSADAQKLLSLKRSLPPDQFGDVAANIVSELGKQTAGAAPAGEAGFSPSTFVTNYNKMAPRSREILFGAVGGGGEKASRLKAELDNLAYVVDRLKGIEKGANTSKTAVNAQSLATGGALLSPAAPAAATLLGSITLTGEAMTNPAFVRWLARSVEAKARTPQAYDVFLRQLGSAAKSNAALIPLYQQQTLLLAGPKATTAVAAKEDQGSTPQ